MARDRPTEMQLAVAKCITFLYRAGAISAEDPKILYKTLPVLVSRSLICRIFIRIINIQMNVDFSGISLSRTIFVERTCRSSRDLGIFDRSKRRAAAISFNFKSFDYSFDFLHQL